MAVEIVNGQSVESLRERLTARRAGMKETLNASLRIGFYRLDVVASR